MNLTKEEKEKLKKEMLHRGNTDVKTDFFNTREYNNLKIDFINCLDVYKDRRLKYKLIAKRDVLDAGRSVIEKHTDGTDIRIPYTDGDNLTTQLDARFGLKFDKSKLDDILEYINNNIEFRKVYDIPVDIIVNGDNNGITCISSFYPDKDLDYEAALKLKEYVSRIKLIGPCTENSDTKYVHEMYHALMIKNQGSIEHYLHAEAPSIFMEYVATLDLNLETNPVDIAILQRLLMVKGNVLNREYNSYYEKNNESTLGSETYILSTALATDLFDKYQKGSNKVKKEIDNSINGVISGHHTFEDVLREYDVDPEHGSKIMRKQIKKFSRL